MTSWAFELGQWFRCDARRRPLDGERFTGLPPIRYGDTFSEDDARRLTEQQAVAASDQPERELPLAQRVEQAREALERIRSTRPEQNAKTRAAEVRRSTRGER